MTDLRSLFPEDDDLRWSFRTYAIACLAHRLRKLGFESCINHYDHRELRLLASMMPPYQATVLLTEADRKQAQAVAEATV